MPGGRPRGSLNKTTIAVKQAIQLVYDELQQGSGTDHGHFLAWAKEEPTEFYKLYAKLLPQEIKNEHTGPDGSDLLPTGIQVTFVGADGRAITPPSKDK